MTGIVDRLKGELQSAARGRGPFLQRDYWAVVRECRLSPSEVVSLLRRKFWQLPPAELVTFRRTDGSEEPLEVGDEMEVRIRGAGKTGVRVLHRDEASITVGTMKGHPEAGRITFGAYPNHHGDVIFHIRSRARSGSWIEYGGFLAAGEPMQTNTWTDFVDRLAHTVGDGVHNAIYAETRELRDLPDEEEVMDSPTFIARCEHAA